MKEYSIKEHFLDRIYGEYQAYKASVLSCPNDEIFSRCYEILAEKADGLSEHMLSALLQHKNILMELYELWLKKDDCNYREMENHVEDEIGNIMREIQEKQEGGIDG